jgi:hypothetical protein
MAYTLYDDDDDDDDNDDDDDDDDTSFFKTFLEDWTAGSNVTCRREDTRVHKDIRVPAVSLVILS